MDCAEVSGGVDTRDAHGRSQKSASTHINARRGGEHTWGVGGDERQDGQSFPEAHVIRKDAAAERRRSSLSDEVGESVCVGDTGRRCHRLHMPRKPWLTFEPESLSTRPRGTVMAPLKQCIQTQMQSTLCTSQNGGSSLLFSLRIIQASASCWCFSNGVTTCFFGCMR